MVYRRKNKTGNFQAISSLLPANQSWYRDEDVLAGDFLEYKVAAINHKGEIFTNKTSLTISPETPLTPRDIRWSYSEEESKITISWVYNFKVDGFILYDLTQERTIIIRLSSEERSCEIELNSKGDYRFALTSFYQKSNNEIIESLDSRIIHISIP